MKLQSFVIHASQQLATQSGSIGDYKRTHAGQQSKASTLLTAADEGNKRTNRLKLHEAFAEHLTTFTMITAGQVTNFVAEASACHLPTIGDPPSDDGA
eukprot:6178783-Pleurochrysis_carterae.AAC.3